MSALPGTVPEGSRGTRGTGVGRAPPAQGATKRGKSAMGVC